MALSLPYGQMLLLEGLLGNAQLLPGTQGCYVTTGPPRRNSHSVFRQGCPPIVTTQGSCGGVGVLSPLPTQMPPPWGDRRGHAILLKAIFLGLML